MKKLLFFSKVSRPRFWLYLAGPFAIGYLAAVNNISELNNALFYFLLFYFLILSNIYLYGINDYFDLDTDILNSKKEAKEIRLEGKQERNLIKMYSIAYLLISLIIILTLPNYLSKIFLFLFIFLSTFYSADPLRFKKRPLVDSLSNLLYVVPGFFAYSLVSNSVPPITIIFATWAWVAAMHLFSAIPDIKADKEANLETSAILLGEKYSLLTCFLLWLIFSILMISSGRFNYFSYIFLIYPVFIAIMIIQKIRTEDVYWYFPIINGLIGFITFWYIVWLK